jgi:hypothetical protein
MDASVDLLSGAVGGCHTARRRYFGHDLSASKEAVSELTTVQSSNGKIVISTQEIAKDIKGYGVRYYENEIRIGAALANSPKKIQRLPLLHSVYNSEIVNAWFKE